MQETISSSIPIPELIESLDKIFMVDGVIQPVSLSEIDAIPRNNLRVYCQIKGVYAIISPELCMFLTNLIGDRKAIEIGSGNGTLALGLNIKATDNKMQRRPEIVAHYFANGQFPIMYPKFVEEIDGIAAIKKYRPEIVVGSWITNKCFANDPVGFGNALAPDEREIVDNCERYIMVGNLGVHKNNRLFNNPKYNVVFHRPDCLRSKAINPNHDCIFEFSKK